MDGSTPKYVGARITRLEDPRLLTGRGRFTADITPQGTLHMALVRSDQPHARINSIDCSEALKLPGVVAAFTADDLITLVAPLSAPSRMKNYYATPLHALASERLRYVGEPVAAILAESRYIAEDAAELIAVDAEPLSVATDPEAALEENAPLLHEPAGTNVIVERAFARGEAEAAMAGAAVRVGGRFRFRRKTPGAIENRACVADYDAGRDMLTLHSTTQVPGIIRDALCEVLGLPGHSLRVVAPDVGGGFGGKTALYPEEILVTALARHMGCAVKWAGDRLEDLTSTNQAFDEIADAELGLDADGTIVALTADVISDIGAYSIYPWTAGLEPVQVVSFLPGPYKVQDYHGRVRAVATPKAPGGPYRGVGRPISCFIMERLMDMAAAELKLDPVELRRRNMVSADEFPYKTAVGIVWDRAGFIECLDAAQAAIGYSEARAEQDKARSEGRLVGIGFAAYSELTGLGSRISAAPGMPINTGTESATIRIDSTGAVTARFGIASHGQGLETSLAQIVADELGVRPEDVKVIHGDSAAGAHGTGTYASRSAVLAGGAATLSSQAVREKVIKAAAHLLEADEGDIEILDGRISIAGTDRALSFNEMARAFYSQMGSLPKELREELDDLEATKMYDPFFGTATCATHAAMVEIDPKTFQVTVRKFVVAEDCGRVINPLIVDGQVHGGVAQGIGAALLEEVVYDETGQLLSASFVDYLLPSACEIPDMDVAHLELGLPNTIGGYRGMGEGGTIGAPAAIANAISDALSPLGVTIMDLPATPERIFRLVQAAKG